MPKNTFLKFVPVICAIVLIGLFARGNTAQANPNIAVEGALRATFPHAPEMLDIARCESGMRQFRADGSLVRGGSTGRYIGIFQIDEHLHTAKAKSLGYDIYTVEGNIAYAHYMHVHSGTNPWKGCLPSSAPAPAASTAAVSVPVTAVAPTVPTSAPVNGSLTTNMSIGMSNAQVLVLQQILNGVGFTVAPAGPGSPGQETSFFGSLTREAVRKFQCAKQIVCAGDESSTGFGRVGPMTRGALNAL